MRELILLESASLTILDVANFINSINVPSSSNKWIDNLHDFINEYALNNFSSFPLCSNKKLAMRKFSCVINKKKWVIIFKYNKNEFIVHKINLGSKLK